MPASRQRSRRAVAWPARDTMAAPGEDSRASRATSCTWQRLWRRTGDDAFHDRRHQGSRGRALAVEQELRVEATQEEEKLESAAALWELERTRMAGVYYRWTVIISRAAIYVEGLGSHPHLLAEDGCRSPNHCDSLATLICCMS